MNFSESVSTYRNRFIRDIDLGGQYMITVLKNQFSAVKAKFEFKRTVVVYSKAIQHDVIAVLNPTKELPYRILR